MRYKKDGTPYKKIVRRLTKDGMDPTKLTLNDLFKGIHIAMCRAVLEGDEGVAKIKAIDKFTGGKTKNFDLMAMRSKYKYEIKDFKRALNMAGLTYNCFDRLKEELEEIREKRYDRKPIEPQMVAMMAWSLCPHKCAFGEARYYNTATIINDGVKERLQPLSSNVYTAFANLSEHKYKLGKCIREQEGSIKGKNKKVGVAVKLYINTKARYKLYVANQEKD